MSDNPFQTPVETGEVGAESSEPQLDQAASMLQQTGPWVRFISVMTFIGSAFMGFAGLAMLMMGREMAPGLGPVVGAIYLGMALLYLFPAIFLWSYASRISIFLRNRNTRTLAKALESQKWFWKFVGILMLIMLVLYGLAILFMIVSTIGANSRF